MCLIIFSHQPGQALPLVLAANRDEFHARATEPSHFAPRSARSAAAPAPNAIRSASSVATPGNQLGFSLLFSSGCSLVKHG